VPREDAMKRTTSLLLAALMGLASAAYAADTTPAKPLASRSDPHPGVTPHTPLSSPPLAPPPTRRTTHPAVTPNTPPLSGSPPSGTNPIATGDEDLEDLEVQRLKSKNQPLRTPAATRRATQPEVTPHAPLSSPRLAPAPTRRTTHPAVTPNTPPLSGSPPSGTNPIATGDEDLEDLEVQRLKSKNQPLRK
jgi:hypothetical protein